MEMKPITREETFLAKAAGYNVETPTPITRQEMFMQKVIDNSGGGSGGGVAIDTTLSKSGQAADAKAVGDALNEIGQMAQDILPSLLPVVAAADNGKILQVVDGAWGAVAMTDVSEVGM